MNISDIIWCFEEGFNSPQAARLMGSAQKLGCKAMFGRPDSSEKPTIFYGSLNWIQNQAWAIKALVGCYWYNQENLTVSNYLAYWGLFSIHHNYGFYPFSEIRRLNEKIYENYYVGYPNDLKDLIFIKPNPPTKIFDGELVNLRKLDEWLNFFSKVNNVSCNLLCLVSTPTKIYREYRLIIANRKVITGSRYILEGKIDIDKEVPSEIISFGKEVVNFTEWQPDKIYTLDVANSYNGICLLGIGCVNCSNIYDCETDPIVQAMSEECLKEWHDFYPNR